MSKHYVIFVLGFLLVLVSCTPPAIAPVTNYNFPPYSGEAAPIYIFPAKTTNDETGEIVQRILQDEALTNYHFASRFTVVDRDATDTLFDLMVDEQLGLISEDALVEMGQQLGASFVLTFTTDISKANNPIKGSSILNIVQPNLARVTLTLRLTNIETGQVVATGSGKGSRVGGILSGVPFQESIRDASVNALNNLLSQYVSKSLQ